MEKVHFIQFEIFEASKRVAQFGGSPADRKKLVRKARMMAQKVVDKLHKQNEDPWYFPRRFVSVRDWSDSSNTRKTASGWLATLRNFYRGDLDKGRARKIIQTTAANPLDDFDSIFA